MDISKPDHSRLLELPRVVRLVGQARLSRIFCVALGFALAFDGGYPAIAILFCVCAILAAAAEDVAGRQAALKSDIITAAVDEYEVTGRWSEDETVGRRAAIRGLLARLKISKALDPALAARSRREQA